VEQELLLDGGVPAVGGVHGGALIELPLSYNLTGHTGSFMYMAPEVFKVRFSCEPRHGTNLSNPGTSLGQ
jgi:hypothetical protein